MNTQIFTKAGKSVARHKGNIATSSVMALLISGALQLGEKWLDGNQGKKELEATEERLNKRIDEARAEQIQNKTDQRVIDQAQWSAIGKKRDK